MNANNAAVVQIEMKLTAPEVQTSTEMGDQHKYQTRIVSSANKANLKFDEAKPVLEAQLAKSIAGIL